FQAVDVRYKAGARHYKTSMDLLAKGIDQANNALIDQAGAELRQGNASIQAASTLLNAMAK
ncbi:MAG: hypothetical protein M3Z04_23120, partial [Chloroflexota bacterium]|nr:hypothetical protein [Chloroflexota bacterium]